MRGGFCRQEVSNTLPALKSGPRALRRGQPYNLEGDCLSPAHSAGLLGFSSKRTPKYSLKTFLSHVALTQNGQTALLWTCRII